MWCDLSALQGKGTCSSAWQLGCKFCAQEYGVDETKAGAVRGAVLVPKSSPVPSVKQ